MIERGYSMGYSFTQSAYVLLDRVPAADEVHSALSDRGFTITRHEQGVDLLTVATASVVFEVTLQAEEQASALIDTMNCPFPSPRALPAPARWLHAPTTIHEKTFRPVYKMSSRLANRHIILHRLLLLRLNEPRETRSMMRKTRRTEQEHVVKALPLPNTRIYRSSSKNKR